jgi:hypothetical protein
MTLRKQDQKSVQKTSEKMEQKMPRNTHLLKVKKDCLKNTRFMNTNLN